jgi:flavin-dependent dehydrogenase
MTATEETTDYDVVILGGAFSGSSAGLLLKRQHPHLRILIVEKSTQFDRKVGESTSEVAGCFLTKVLKLDSYLARNHIVKHGLRMWFTTPENKCMEACSEIGPFYQVRLPTYQLDRSHLDPHILGLATEAGCELLRPATIRGVDLGGIGNNTVEVKVDGETKMIRAKWVIDASGKAAFLARKLGKWRELEDHPTNATWARFNNVKDFDGAELAEKYPDYAKAVYCTRGQATNHLMGRGWWAWIIPLRDGEVSAGVTYDPRLFDFPAEGTLSERLKSVLVSHPVGREIFGDAVPVEKDTRSYSKLPYYTEQAMGDGWACVGDAAGFMDPLYSQGLDYCAHTVYTTQNIVAKSLAGECVNDHIADYNHQFRTSYFRWWNSLYKDKYKYLGDMELMTAAFLMDIGTYFIGPVRLVHEFQEQEFTRLPYFGTGGKVFASFMTFYNKRLGKLADKRFAAGVYGKMNTNHRYLTKDGFTADLKAFKLLRRGVYWWLKCEVKCLFLPSPSPEKLTKNIIAATEVKAPV